MAGQTLEASCPHHETGEIERDKNSAGYIDRPWFPNALWATLLEPSPVHHYVSQSSCSTQLCLYLQTTLETLNNWDAFNPAWEALLKSEGITYCHAKDLKNRKNQFQGWSPQRCDAFIYKAHHIVEQHLEFGATTIIRQDDYDAIYKAHPNPNRLRQDTKYGVLFRGCLHIIEGAIACQALTTTDVTLKLCTGKRSQELWRCAASL